MNRLMLIAILFLWFNTGFSQVTEQEIQTDTANFPYWVEMMQDPNANFYETQRAFNAYWENREITRGSGWKPFKRWEYYMSKRVDAQGQKPQSEDILKAYDIVKSISDTRSPSGNWKVIGPVNLPVSFTGQPNGLGRINVVAFHPTNENVLFIGAPAGGLWKTIDHGQNWQNLTDRMPTLGVSAITVNPANDNNVFIGTGDRDANDSEGMGVFVSYDGGVSWEQRITGMGNVTVNKLLINPLNPNTVLAASNSGIYKSDDAGLTWKLKTSGTVKSMECKPNNPDVVYAIKGGSYLKSTDGGETWNTISVSSTAWNRAVLGVTPANPELVYILSTNTRTYKALYLSYNSGESFATMSTTPNIMGYSNTGTDDGGQAWYDLCMAVDQLNPGTVYAGGINIFKSTDFGKTWRINAHWVGTGAPAVHADHHDMAFNPLNNALFSCNDGGIYYTKNGGTSWINNSSGLSISQIYKLSQSQTQRDMVMCGNQDNGTSLWSDGSWSAVIGGDGMECIIDPTNHNYKYGSVYYGDVFRSVNGSGFQAINSDINEDGAWVSPYILSPADPKVMFLGLVNIWRTTNVRATSPTWKSITNSLGLTGNISSLDCSSANPSIAYFSTSDNKTYRTLNVNATSPQWTKLTTPANVNDIKAHPSNENIVYMVGSNNSVYRSTDNGTVWNNISSGLPIVSLNCIAIDKNSNEGLYLGTDMGVFYKDATMTKWQYYSNGLPAATRITEIEIYYDALNSTNNALRVSTYGRGTWESDLYSEPITQPQAVRITALKAPVGNFEPSDLVVPEIEIRNIGSDSLKTLSILYVIDQKTVDTLEFNLLLSTHQNTTVKFPALRHAAGQHAFKAEIIAVNGNSFTEQISSTFTVTAAQLFRFTLTTDSLASETTWQLQDTASNIISSSGTYLDDTIYFDTVYFNLTSGCYRLIVTDTNGICCVHGSGLFDLVKMADSTLLGNGSQFSISDTISFCVDTLPTPDFYSFTAYKVGEAITFTNKTNNSNYGYQWTFGNDATPSEYVGEVPPTVTFSSEGPKTISLLATNQSASSVMVKNNYVSVYAEPILTQQPENIQVCPNDDASFSVSTQGYNLSYQWYFNDQSLTNQFYPKLLIENITAENEGSYYCRISNPKWMVYSDTVTLTMLEAPSLELSASANPVCTGTELTLSASSNGTITWANNLETTSEIKVTPAVSTVYAATASNGTCSLTREISITVAKTPVITQTPVSKTVCEGKAVTFVAGASGNALTYNWVVDSTEFNNASNILNIANTLLEYDGIVTCTAINVCGQASSDPVKLTVDPLPTANYTVQITGNIAEFTNTALNAKLYEWDFGDGSTTQLIQPTHIYEDGTYTVEQRAFNDCGSDTLATSITIGQSSVDDLSANEKLNVYPNPSGGLVNVSMLSETLMGLVQINVINIEGKIIDNFDLVKEQPELVVPINLMNYPKGIYQLVITNQQRIFSRRLVIE